MIEKLRSLARSELAWLLLLVGLPVLLNAIALLPEVAIPVPNVNDDAEHFLFIQRASEALNRGENPLDMWVPQLELGFPQFLYYQHLPHLFVVALHRLLFGALDLRLVFDAVRYGLLLTLPITVFWSMRTLGFGRPAAAIAAAASTLLSGGHRYGFEYDSYIWRGFGLFTQLFGMHLAFISVAALARALHRGRGLALAALALAALALSHLIYAYMLGITALALVAFGVSRATLLPRLKRLALVATPALGVSAYMFLPFLGSSGYLNASPYLDQAKYDSFGAGPILQWLVTGDLLDHGRLPVLTALLAVGVASALITRARPALLALALFALWLVLYFGRPTLGPLMDLLPMHEGLLLHRFIGPVDLFAIILIGAGGGWVWHLSRSPSSPARRLVVAGVLALILLPALGERWGYYAENRVWLEQTKAALDADRGAAEIVEALRSLPPGRVYAGLNAGFGKSLDFGLPFTAIRFYNLFAFYGLDAVSPPYRGASLNSDLLFDFDPQNLAHYRVFNVDYVVAPREVKLPAELQRIREAGRYVLYGAPGGGYADFVNAVRRERPSSRANHLERMRGWLSSADPAARKYVVYDYLGSAPSRAGEISSCPTTGGVDHERVGPARFDLHVQCASPGTLVVKTTYHPNWRVTVDGVPVRAYMVSPSFVAIDLPPGQHLVVAEYESSPLRNALAILGLGAAALTVAARRRLDAVAEADHDGQAAPVPKSRVPALVPRQWPSLDATRVLARDVRARVRVRRVRRVRWSVPVGATGYVACAGIVTAVLALTMALTPPIAFNNGLGHDGQLYGAMVDALRDGTRVAMAPPWSYRIAPSAIVAALGLDAKIGFRLLDVASIYGSGLLLFALLRHYRVALGLSLLGVFWWSALPLGLRYAAYYPVLPDSFGFFLLTMLVFAAVTRRTPAFALALIAAALTRENLLALVPFLWLSLLGKGIVPATIQTALAALPAAAAFLWVHAFPPFPPPPGFENWAERYRIDVNLWFVTSNTDGHAWRYLLAAPLTLGFLVTVPVLAFDRVRRFLRHEVAWAYYLVATMALALIGGRDDDRYVYLLTPALLVLTFVAAGGKMWSSLRRVAAFTGLHLLALRFLWPVGTSEADYLQYTVAFMSLDRLQSVATIVAATWTAAVVVLHPARVGRPLEAPEPAALETR